MQYRTLLSIATPISVKANAPYLLPPQLEVTFWHLKIYLRQSRGRGVRVCRKGAYIISYRHHRLLVV